MKNKRINYFLLPLAIGIWGYAVYYVFNSYSAGTDRPTLQVLANANLQTEVLKQDTFSLLLNYPDPFTKAIRIKKMEPEKAKKSIIQTVKKSAITTESQMPAFIYKGYISKQDSDEKMGIFQIADKQVFLREKEGQSGITIISIKPSEVVVQWNKQKRTFPITKK